MTIKEHNNSSSSILKQLEKGVDDLTCKDADSQQFCSEATQKVDH